MAEIIPQQRNNNELKKFIEFYTSNLRNNLEFEIRFGTKSKKKFLKDDIDNIIKKLLSEGFVISRNNEYKLNIASEFIDSSGNVKQNSNIRTEVKGLHNIRKYCKTNTLADTMNYEFTQKKRVQIQGLINPFDVRNFNLRYSIQEEKSLKEDLGIIQTLKNSWTDYKKYFRLINRIELTHPNYPFRVDISTVKSSKLDKDKRPKYTYTLEESNLFNNTSHYEVEIELLNDKIQREYILGDKTKTVAIIEKILKQGIKLILIGLQESNFPINEYEKTIIINEYQKLIGLERKPFLKTREFIGPSTFTLQKNNLIKDENQKIPNILDDYTVTEKADGIRKMLYISKNGKIYFITMNMNIQYTGVKTKNSNLFESLFDGEHVMYSKTGSFVNLYLCFDCYFIQKRDIRSEPFIENEFDDRKTYRLKVALTSFKNLRKEYESPSYKFNLNLDTKDFILTNKEANISIFDICKVMIEREKNDYYFYETDGLVFTPQLLGVGANNIGDSPKNYKITWEHSFKWKPPQYNTIDFMVEIEKENRQEKIKLKQSEGINLGKQDEISYKTLLLKVGYDRRKHGYLNPQLDIIEGRDTANSSLNNGTNNYAPGLFYPTNPYDNNAHICNIEMKMMANGEKDILTEEGELIEDHSIVEFKYIKENEDLWKWVPLRVRYDKTNELRTTKNNFGNAYHVANSNWQSIHNPITEDMLSTGRGIFIDSGDDDVYYNKKKMKRVIQK